MTPVQISLDNSGSPHAISENLYGIFFEDINFSCDGGINANMVNNYSFDGVFFSNEELRAVDDPLRYWIVENGSLESGTTDQLHPNSRYGRVHARGNTILANYGFNGLKKHRDECAVSICKEHTYLFECWVRPENFAGTLTIQVTDGKGRVLALTKEPQGVCQLASRNSSQGEEHEYIWKKFCCKLKGIETGYGRLELILQGTGVLDLDCVSLMDDDYWHKGDPKWRHGKLRKDLIQVLADMKPSFMRFPGGCIVEGQLPGNEYNWKDTVGELYERRSNYNLWSEKVPDGGYNQSYQIGFYEYFCLCEDLGMKPLPTLTAGLNCQIRSMQRGEAECPNIPTDSEEFQTRIIDSYLDLIEFANGDPNQNEWAALRAKMGHPEPFGLDRIGIGNENYDEVYYKRFDLIEHAIHAKYPDMVCILCAGVHPYYEEMMGSPGLNTVYEFAKKHKNVLVDEHSYHTPEWFAQQAVRFDHYDRGGAGVYFGEYAANGLLGLLESMMPQSGATVGTPQDSSFLGNGTATAGMPQDSSSPENSTVGTPQDSSSSKNNTATAQNGTVAAPEELPAASVLDMMDPDENAPALGMRPMNQSNQLDTALGEAAFLTGLERNGDIVAMASYAPLFNLTESDQWNHNLINFNPRTFCLSTNYYVQKMFACHLGTRYLPYKGSLPEDYYFSATEDEKALYLKLVNTGADSCDIEVKLPGGSPAWTKSEKLAADPEKLPSDASPACEAVTACGEVLWSKDPHVRNDLKFDGDAVYHIYPETIRIPVMDGTLQIKGKPFSVYALTVMKP